MKHSSSLSKLLMVLLVILSISSSALATTTEPDIVNTQDLNAYWTFPVPLHVIHKNKVLLVNNQNLLTEKDVPDPLVNVTKVKRATSAAVYLQLEAAEALQEMFDAAKDVTSYTYLDMQKETPKEVTVEYPNGMVLYLKSGYRSYGTQVTTYNNYLARNNNVDDGYVSKPGASEHQTGLAMDILNAEFAGRSYMTQDFEYEPEAQWLKENCSLFGFILRYPKEAEDITEINFEPWHFRYVGKDVASYIMGNGLTLEEYVGNCEFEVAQFIGAGGDIDQQMAYEISHINAPPESTMLNVTDTIGDNEISLKFF